MPNLITTELLAPYFQEDKKHTAYKETVTLMKNMRVHADGEFPEELIGKYRPNEEKEVYEYRKSIYQAITETAISRIVNFLSLIRKSRDWAIIYDQEDLPNTLRSRPEDTLEAYTSKQIPVFTSMTNWLFEVCLKQYLVDPNALCLVLPRQLVVEQGKFQQPMAYIFNSEEVIEYIQGEFCLVLSLAKSTYTDGKATFTDGKIYYALDTQVVQKWEQTKSDGTMSLAWEYKHGIGQLPAFKLGGIVSKIIDKTYIYKSRIHAVVSHLNLVVNEFSDLQAEVVQHIHSEKWVYHNTECGSCNGTGQDLNYTPTVNGDSQICSTCKGSRYIPSVSPYKHIVVTPNKPGENPFTGEPAGYISKSTDIVKIQDERIEKHFYRAFSAIELQNLAKTPMAESGIAKDVDRDQQDIFVNACAESLVNIKDKVMYFMNEYRYSVAVPDPQVRIKMLPKIIVPEKFNLLSASYLIDDLKKARDASVNPLVIRSMEVELAGKQFSSDPELKNRLQLVLDLDPLFGLTDEQKLLRLNNKGVSQEMYVISSQINYFIKQALFEDKTFVNLPFDKQYEKLQEYAQAQIEAMSAASDVMKLVKV